MTYFGELVFNGISIGCLYALITLGFVVIFKATHVINFAAGSMLLLGAYVVAKTHDPLGFWPSLVLGVAVGAVCALAIERLLIGRHRHGDAGALGILMIGVDILLTTDLTRRIGSDVLTIGDPWGAHTFQWGPFTIPQARLAAALISGGLVALFFVAYKYSSWGLATRASAENAEASELMGIRRWQVSSVTWAVAGALSTVAGVFLGTSPNPGITNTSHVASLNAFPAAVIGGLDSTGGAVAGGILVGLVQSLTAGYSEHLTFLGSPLGEVAPYVVMLLVLLWRPAGLFGTKELTRV
jgi:branched-chain amino acid transport system permease protein